MIPQATEGTGETDLLAEGGTGLRASIPLAMFARRRLPAPRTRQAQNPHPTGGVNDKLIVEIRCHPVSPWIRGDIRPNLEKAVGPEERCGVAQAAF
jgi:hypothetical protein